MARYISHCIFVIAIRKYESYPQCHRPSTSIAFPFTPIFELDASPRRSHIYIPGNTVSKTTNPRHHSQHPLTCNTVSPKKIISFLVSSTIRSWIWNHFSPSPPPPAARRCTFHTVCSLSRVVPATDSCVTFAIRSYSVCGCEDGASRTIR